MCNVSIFSNDMRQGHLLLEYYSPCFPKMCLSGDCSIKLEKNRPHTASMARLNLLIWFKFVLRFEFVKGFAFVSVEFVDLGRSRLEV